MNGAALPLTLREWAREALSPFGLAILAIVTLVLTISGPFDTLRSLETTPRALYWALTCLTSYLAAKTVAILLRPSLARRIAAPQLRLLVLSLILTLPAGGAALIVHVVFFGWWSPDITPVMLLQSAASTICVTLVVGLTRQRLTAAALEQRGASAPGPADEARPALLARLPVGCRGPLIALSAEDHYVAIRTERGRALVLMRLADAIREAAPTPGLQIHRSHWVALDAVQRVKRQDGRLAVTLRDGSVLPVSRGFAEAVRNAGLSS